MKQTLSERISAQSLRMGAVERLKAEHGIRIASSHWNNEYLAEQIKKVVPGLNGDPAFVVRFYALERPDNVVKPRQFLSTGRTYSAAATMRGVVDRLAGTPKPLAMVSNVPPTAMDWR